MSTRQSAIHENLGELLGVILKPRQVLPRVRTR